MSGNSQEENYTKTDALLYTKRKYCTGFSSNPVFPFKCVVVSAEKSARMVLRGPTDPKDGCEPEEILAGDGCRRRLT